MVGHVGACYLKEGQLVPLHKDGVVHAEADLYQGQQDGDEADAPSDGEAAAALQDGAAHLGVVGPCGEVVGPRPIGRGLTEELALSFRP